MRQSFDRALKKDCLVSEGGDCYRHEVSRRILVACGVIRIKASHMKRSFRLLLVVIAPFCTFALWSAPVANTGLSVTRSETHATLSWVLPDSPFVLETAPSIDSDWQTL